MKLKSVYSLAIALAVLLVIYAGLIVNERVTDKAPSVADTGVDITALADAEKITFTPAEGSAYALERKAGKWLVGGKAADAATVKAFLKAVRGMGVDLLISTSGKDLARYGLAKPAELTMIAEGGGKKQSLSLSGTGAPAGRFYLLGKDGKSVFLMKGGLDKYLGKKAADWQPKAKPAAAVSPAGTIPAGGNADELLKQLGNGATPAK